MTGHAPEKPDPGDQPRHGQDQHQSADDRGDSSQDLVSDHIMGSHSDACQEGPDEQPAQHQQPAVGNSQPGQHGDVGVEALPAKQVHGFLLVFRDQPPNGEGPQRRRPCR